ncbi:MAG: DUF6285 domain-containing protein [Hyphomonadaceae bacterium]
MNSQAAQIAELIGVVSRYLRRDLRPELEGRHVFLTLVASNLLESLAREAVLGDAAQRDEVTRLTVLLGADGDVATLNAELCRRIARGDIDETSRDLMDHLAATALDRLAIEQPTYEAYRRERGV